VYWKGHYGVSLVVFAPVGYTLLRLGYPTLALVAGAAMLWLAMLPDVDHKLPFVSHRGPTHSLSFAVLVGAVLGGAGSLLDAAGEDLGVATTLGGVELSAVGFAVGVLAVVAHLLGDVLTPMGVNFLWPVSSRRYSLSLWRADNRLANYGLFAAGVFVTVGWVYLAAVV
jgi:inner membrane protein